MTVPGEVLCLVVYYSKSFKSHWNISIAKNSSTELEMEEENFSDNFDCTIPAVALEA